MDVPEPYVVEQLQFRTDARLALEEFQGVGDAQVEHVRDGLSFISDLERLAVVAATLAHLAGHVDVGEEVHLDLDEPVPLAGLAAAPLHVEREPARPVAADLGLGQESEELANRS